VGPALDAIAAEERDRSFVFLAGIFQEEFDERCAGHGPSKCALREWRLKRVRKEPAGRRPDGRPANPRGSSDGASFTDSPDPRRPKMRRYQNQRTENGGRER